MAGVVELNGRVNLHGNRLLAVGSSLVHDSRIHVTHEQGGHGIGRVDPVDIGDGWWILSQRGQTLGAEGNPCSSELNWTRIIRGNGFKPQFFGSLPLVILQDNLPRWNFQITAAGVVIEAVTLVDLIRPGDPGKLVRGWHRVAITTEMDNLLMSGREVERVLFNTLPVLVGSRWAGFPATATRQHEPNYTRAQHGVWNAKGDVSPGHRRLFSPFEREIISGAGP